MKFALTLATLGFATAAHADFDNIRDCSWAADEIETVGIYVTDHWSSFESFLEAETGESIGSCLENRFKSNGNVECETTGGSCADNGDVNGWASYLSQTAHVCFDPFLENLQSFSDDNQEACLVALLTHEFGHTCWRGHGSVEEMDNAAFRWYKGRADQNVTIRLSDCGMD